LWASHNFALNPYVFTGNRTIMGLFDFKNADDRAKEQDQKDYEDGQKLGSETTSLSSIVTNGFETMLRHRDSPFMKGYENGLQNPKKD
jgi:hypothetical protein